MHRLAQNRPQHHAEKADAERRARRRCGVSVPSTNREPITISQPVVFEPLEDARDVAGVVLAVAVHADHVLEAQFVRQFVAGLHAAAQAQMVRQRQHRRRRRRARTATVPSRRAIVDHQHRARRARARGSSATTPPIGAFLVAGGHDDQQASRDRAARIKAPPPSWR